MPGGGGLHPLLQPVEGGQVLRKGRVQHWAGEIIDSQPLAR